MASLPSDRHRMFVCSLFELPPGRASNSSAAKVAGFGAKHSSAVSWAVIGHRLAHDARILAAIREEGVRRMTAASPRAIRALVQLVENDQHRDHARAIGMLLDRTFPTETAHRVEVAHRHEITITTAEALRRIEELARKAGIDTAAMPPLIDVTPEAAT